MKLKFALLVILGALQSGAAAEGATVNTGEMGRRVLERGLQEMQLGSYMGTLLLEGMSELALNSGDVELRARTEAYYRKFATGEITVRGGNFFSYDAGGSGAALLVWKGLSPGLAEGVAFAARRMFNEQRRSREGILMVRDPKVRPDQVFIDIAFAVTPFLLYAGLHEHRDDYVDLAVHETIELFRVLRDPATGLLQQGRGFIREGENSQDNWSRGNGWGAIALAVLVRDLPTTHPRRTEVETLARDFYPAVLRYQNPEGLWHQEMTVPASYVETSGSALLLYFLGVLLEKGLLPKQHVEAYERGLGALAAYVAADGSVSHTCGSCRVPGGGTKYDYQGRLWKYNDPHAFGAVLLAYAQAEKLGIREVTSSLPPGIFASPIDAPGAPATHVRLDPDHNRSLTWENDRIAFRVFGSYVEKKAGSGVDVWAKSVAYPTVEKWYRLNAAGFNYHTDRGEGCDFYPAGFERGCGGLAVISDGQPVIPGNFDSAKIIRDDAQEILFEVSYNWWLPARESLAAVQRFRMVLGTQFTEVTTTITGHPTEEFTVGIGLTDFGHAVVSKNDDTGALVLSEQIDPTHGALGTAVIVDPALFGGFALSGRDRYVRVKAKSGQPFRYFIGAGWARSPEFRTEDALVRYLLNESGWDALNRTYADRRTSPEVAQK